MKLIDLHTHTTASDGSLTPRELVYAAITAKLKAIAITDHDTIDGLAEALAVGAQTGLEIVPGVEISIQGIPSGSLHILGLYVDYKHVALLKRLQYLQSVRIKRNFDIIQKMNRLGIPISIREVENIACGKIISRLHFAQFLIKQGLVMNWREAFARYLGVGALAYVPKHRFLPKDGIAMIREARGIPILAHPGILNLANSDLERLIQKLMKYGLQGVEALYSEHNHLARNEIFMLTKRLGLLVSGGTDFHGFSKPNIRLGVGLGDLKVPSFLLAEIKKRRN